jgi:hypothetical protein
MAFNKTNLNSKPRQNGILRVIWGIIFFPFAVRKRYLRYNGVLWEAEQEVKNLQLSMQDYRRNNTKLLNIFVHAPLAMSVVVAAAMIYLQMEGFTKFSSKLTDFPRITITKPKITNQNFKRYFKEVAQTGREVNIKFIFLAISACYGLCFVGAMILSINDAWGEERTIRDALISNRYLDFNGEPWKVFWTPEAIIFHTYQCDSSTLVNNDKFWNTINFKPDIPTHFKMDANKIIIGRAYALPAIIDFSMKKTI